MYIIIVLELKNPLCGFLFNKIYLKFNGDLFLPFHYHFLCVIVSIAIFAENIVKMSSILKCYTYICLGSEQW